MKITARRVRDGKGLRPLVNDFFRDEMTTQSLREAGEDVWRVLDLAKFFSSTLEELVEKDSFNFLASRLVNVDGYPPSTRVLAAARPWVKIIEIHGKQFLSVGYMVHEREVK